MQWCCILPKCSLCSPTTVLTVKIKILFFCPTGSSFFVSESLCGLAHPWGIAKTCRSGRLFYLHFFSHRIAFNYHKNSPFTAIMKWRPKQAKLKKPCIRFLLYIISRERETKMTQLHIALYHSGRSPNWSLLGRELDQWGCIKRSV